MGWIYVGIFPIFPILTTFLYLNHIKHIWHGVQVFLHNVTDDLWRWRWSSSLIQVDRQIIVMVDRVRGYQEFIIDNRSLGLVLNSNIWGLVILTGLSIFMLVNCLHITLSGGPLSHRNLRLCSMRLRFGQSPVFNVFILSWYRVLN